MKKLFNWSILLSSIIKQADKNLHIFIIDCWLFKQGALLSVLWQAKGSASIWEEQ